MTTIVKPPSRATTHPKPQSSEPQQQAGLPARPDSVHSSPAVKDLAKRRALIEVLLSRHEEMIDKGIAKFIRQRPEIGEDAIRSTLYMKLVKRCINKDDLLELQSPELQPLNPEREREIIGAMIKYSKLEELDRLRKGGRITRPFSQLDEYDAGQIPGRTPQAATTSTTQSLAVRIADRLAELGIELSDRQFNILLCRVQNSSEPGKLKTYKEIASELNMSDTTVKRDMAKIQQMILAARGVTDPTDSPATIARREDFINILNTSTDLRTRIKEYLEAYVALTDDGKRPTEEALRDRLGLTPSQLRNRRRIAARLRPGLLNELSA